MFFYLFYSMQCTVPYAVSADIPIETKPFSLRLTLWALDIIFLWPSTSGRCKKSQHNCLSTNSWNLTRPRTVQNTFRPQRNWHVFWSSMTPNRAGVGNPCWHEVPFLIAITAPHWLLEGELFSFYFFLTFNLIKLNQNVLTRTFSENYKLLWWCMSPII